MVLLDIARTPEDFEQCRELFTKTHPGEAVPTFGDGKSTTFIAKDTDEPGIKGMIHANIVIELTGMTVDPNYRYQDASYTLLHQSMEGHFRIAGHAAVEHSVQRDQEKVQKMLKKTGAVPVGEHYVRFRKEL